MTGRRGQTASLRWALGMLVAASALAAATRAEEIQLLDRPAFALYTMISRKIDLSEEDQRRLAQNFVYLHGKLTPEQTTRLHQLNPDFKSLWYINSTYTRGPEEVGYAEKEARAGLCMHLSARLSGALDAAATRFAVTSSQAGRRGRAAGEPLAIRASTVEGDFSSLDPKQPSTKFYVFWIRIDDELLRVNKFDPATGAIDVTRAFAATTAAAHADGAQVFSPIYLGYDRATRGRNAGAGTAAGAAADAADFDDWDDDFDAAPAAPGTAPGAKARQDKYPGCHPGGPGSHLRYVLDPASAASNQWKAQEALDAMREHGTDGVWLDTFNCGTFNLCDCLGRKARPWNFAKGEVYAYDDFRENQEKKVATIQRLVFEKLGRYPFLVANNLHEYEPGQGGMKLLLMPTAIKPRPLDGFCMEGGLSPGNAESWVARMQMLADGAQHGLAIMPILAGAGAKSVQSEADTPERDRRERFGYASYLLAVEAGGKAMMGTYACYQQDGKRFVKVNPIYYLPIGKPTQTFEPKDFAKYQAPATSVYRREFSNGVVLVNPTANVQAAVDLGGEYLDPDTKQRVQRVVLPAQAGKILLREGAAK